MSSKLEAIKKKLSNSVCDLVESALSVVIIAIVLYLFKEYVLKLPDNRFIDAIAVAAFTVFMKIMLKIIFALTLKKVAFFKCNE